MLYTVAREKSYMWCNGNGVSCYASVKEQLCYVMGKGPYVAIGSEYGTIKKYKNKLCLCQTTEKKQ